MGGVVRKHLLPGLPTHPDNGFIAIVINHLYDEDVKNGERITHEFFVKCFRQGLEEYYKIPFKRSLLVTDTRNPQRLSLCPFCFAVKVVSLQC